EAFSGPAKPSVPFCVPFYRLGGVRFTGIRDDKNFRVTIEIEFERLHDVQRSKPTAERHMFLRTHVDPAEAQNRVLRPGVSQLLKLFVGHDEPLRTLHDLGTKSAFSWQYFH